MLLAHQGGWDEILFVLLPVSLFGFLLWLANRRALAMQDSPTDADGHTD